MRQFVPELRWHEQPLQARMGEFSSQCDQLCDGGWLDPRPEHECGHASICRDGDDRERRDRDGAVRSPRMLRAVLLVLTFAFVVGCGPKAPRIARIAGRVTLDGKPLPKASVTFAPMATQENPAPGPTAQGRTDADGRYEVSVDVATPGAVVGKCRIYISTRLSDPAVDDR